MGDDLNAMWAEAAAAVDMLYSGGDDASVKRASLWLEEVQHSDKAWDVGCGLLTSPLTGSSAKFLGVSMMQTYVSNVFGSASEETGQEMREQIRGAVLDM